jgi:1-aminocyclopropane-1-carboxylate deaminase
LNTHTKNQYLTTLNGINLTLKRGDLIDPEVSGNKFWKLHYNIKKALELRQTGILTFGGAFSNHLAATAAATAAVGLRSVGVVRGLEWAERHAQNPTLQFCKSKGMQLHYISRVAYREKATPYCLTQWSKSFPNYMILPEGGTNTLALQGCADAIGQEDLDFETICTPVGTGGTLAGLALGGALNQQYLGFAVLRNKALQASVEILNPNSNWMINHDYSMGGYAKTPPELIRFINDFKKKFTIPLDPIYTGKMLFGIFDLINKGLWRWGKNVLIIHTGGLQGIAGINQRLAQKGGVLLD